MLSLPDFFIIGATAQACLLVWQHRDHFDQLAAKGPDLDAFRSMLCFSLISAGIIATGYLFGLAPVPQVIYCPLALFIFGAMLSRDLIPSLNEPLLLSLTLTFWSAWIPVSQQLAPYMDGSQIFLIGIPAVPTCAVLVVALHPKKIGGNFEKLALYGWYLFTMLVVGVLQLPAFSEVSSSTYGMALFGASCSFIAIRAAPMIYLHNPTRGKNWTDAEYRKIVQENRRIQLQIASRFSDSQLSRVQAILILLGQGGLIAANLIFKWLPDSTVTMLCLTIIPQALERVAEAKPAGPV